jgi:hypothetical protein
MRFYSTREIIPALSQEIEAFMPKAYVFGYDLRLRSHRGGVQFREIHQLFKST